jgi:hypothetical protein
MRRRAAAGIGAVIFVIACFVVAGQIQSNAQAGENEATSAPQQTVAETAATRDAGVNGIRLLGVLGGLIIFSLALLTPPSPADEESVEAELIQKGHRSRCPWCLELIRPDAVVCKHCGRDVLSRRPPAEPAPASG